MPAKYPLEEVKVLAQEALNNPDSNKVWFSAPPKSYESVIKALKKQGITVSTDGAQKYILREILNLSPADFMEQWAGQWDDPRRVVDHYGKRKDGIPWFIKFDINRQENFLDELSFHPALKDMRLENKTVISKEWEKI